MNLLDHTNITDLNISTDEILRLAEYSKKTEDVFPISFVAAYVPNDLTFGKVRMFMTHYELQEHSINVSVFRDKEEAIQFLKDKKSEHGQQQGFMLDFKTLYGTVRPVATSSPALLDSCILVIIPRPDTVRNSSQKPPQQALRAPWRNPKGKATTLPIDKVHKAAQDQQEQESGNDHNGQPAPPFPFKGYPPFFFFFLIFYAWTFFSLIDID